MTAQFHEGQKVEIWATENQVTHGATGGIRRKAKIVGITPNCNLWPGPAIEVQFPDGSRAVFDAEHIRAVASHDVRHMGAA